MNFRNTNKPSLHCRLGSATLLRLAFQEGSDPKFPWENSERGKTVVKENIIKKEKFVNVFLNAVNPFLILILFPLLPPPPPQHCHHYTRYHCRLSGREDRLTVVPVKSCRCPLIQYAIVKSTALIYSITEVCIAHILMCLGLS